MIPQLIYILSFVCHPGREEIYYDSARRVSGVLPSTILLPDLQRRHRLRAGPISDQGRNEIKKTSSQYHCNRYHNVSRAADPDQIVPPWS